MIRSELNNITTNLRKTYSGEYKTLKKQCKNMILSREIERRLSAKGFDNYEQIREACPREINISYFILELLK